jgi:hypothetical protein
MIPGGFSPTDRPVSEHELHTEIPRTGRTSAKSAWLTLAVIVLVVVAMIVLLSFIPDA